MKMINVLLIVTVLMTGFISTAVFANEPFIGEVRFVGFNFAPRGWAKCDGQILPINTNQSLYSILGTTYGGDGRTTFALPDMRGRTPIHRGNGPGLSSYILGQKGGAESITLTTAQIPSHHHALKGISSSARTSTPTGNVLARPRSNLKIYDDSVPNIALHNDSVGQTGNASAINNMQPSTTLNCIIALQGLFPPRN